MERLTYVTEKGEILFHPKDLPDDEGMTITQLAEDGRFKALEQIAEILANREQADELGVYGKWIPVSERLPEEPKENEIFDNKPLELYLVSIKGDPYPFRAFWNGKFFTNGWQKCEVTAWMTLPKPYRESEKRMANRNTLHSNKLDAFRKWLIKTGWTIEEPKGIWEVLRAKKAGRQNPLIVYQKNEQRAFKRAGQRY